VISAGKSANGSKARGVPCVPDPVAKKERQYAGCSGDFATPSPPAEKASARQDQAGQARASDGAGHGIGRVGRRVTVVQIDQADTITQLGAQQGYRVETRVGGQAGEQRDVVRVGEVYEQLRREPGVGRDGERGRAGQDSAQAEDGDAERADGRVEGERGGRGGREENAPKDIWGPPKDLGLQKSDPLQETTRLG
jgi:hypothetical protein